MACDLPTLSETCKRGHSLCPMLLDFLQSPHRAVSMALITLLIHFLAQRTSCLSFQSETLQEAPQRSRYMLKLDLPKVHIVHARPRSWSDHGPAGRARHRCVVEPEALQSLRCPCAPKHRGFTWVLVYGLLGYIMVYWVSSCKAGWAHFHSETHFGIRNGAISGVKASLGLSTVRLRRVITGTEREG